MEIHAPGGAVHTVRDFGVHLLIVTLGILIALSLEGLLEWRHHKTLVNEANANMVSELRDNKKELDALLARVPEMHRNQTLILQFIQDVFDRGRSDIHTLQLNFHLAQLGNASWSTAQAVGALGFMPYPDVKKYAAVYQLQDVYARLQDRTVDAAISAMTAFSEGKDPEKLPRTELEEERSKVLASISALTAQSQIGDSLSKAYADLLRSTRQK